MDQTLKIVKRAFVTLVATLITDCACADFPLCSPHAATKEYVSLVERTEKKIEIFANSKTVASKADSVLSKLIAAKSPIIMSWLKNHDLATRSDEEIAKAWRLYFARTLVLTNYPSDDKKIDAEAESLVDGLLKENLTPKFVEKMEALFKRAKQASLQQLQKYDFPQKGAVIERVNAIKLYWPKTLKLARNNAIPLDLIDWGIAYDPVPNEINIGLRAYSYPNDETSLAVFAHEIAHAFDSCRWGAFLKGSWPFEKVGSCLRTDGSVAAKKRDDSLLEKMVLEKKISPELVQSLKQNPTCNKLVYPPIGTQADQLPEAFADWFSAEVMAQMSNIDFHQIRIDLCEDRKLNDGSSYPTNERRLKGIYFSQPQLKSRAGLSGSKTSTYCSFGQ